MILHWILWLLSILGFGALYLYAPGGWTLTLAAAAAAVPILSAVLTLIGRRKLSAVMIASDTATKNEPAVLTLEIRNSSILPFARLRADIMTENRLSGERTVLSPELSIGAKDRQRQEIRFTSACCGAVRAELKRLRASDLFGLVYFPVHCGCSAEILVVPDVFEPLLVLPQPSFSTSESDRYLETKPGYDYSETFQVRDYAEGDSPKQIHWKLSTKLDRLVVRDPSLPLDRWVLLLWERGCRTETPLQSDAMCSALVSVCAALVKNGIGCRVVWNEAEAAECTAFDFREETDLYDMLPKILAAGPAKTELPEQYLRLYGQEKQNKVIFITAGDVSDSAQICPEDNLVVLRCGEGTAAGREYAFSPENTAEALGEIDLT